MIDKDISVEGKKQNVIKKAVASTLNLFCEQEPDKPFYTVEVSTEGKVVQVRGLRNCGPTSEVEEFMINYKSYLKTIFESKKERKSA